MAGFGDVASLLKQAQRMQQEMARVQEDLKQRFVEGVAGGGAVTARFNGNMELVGLRIERGAVDPNAVETLEDLVMVAVRQGLEKSRELGKEQLGRLTGGLSLPGIT